jgi:hypothetical protein
MTTNSDRAFSAAPSPASQPFAGGRPARRPLDDMDRCRTFLADLTQVCARHGIGITGDAVLFVMEPEDYPHHYSVDAESRLLRQ